jgi:SSS family solute:Na+ symporter
VVKDRPDGYYITVGRIATLGATVLAVFTALIAAGYSNLMDYLQTLFGFFNAPLFATFIVGMFWKRMSSWAGFYSLVLGFVASLVLYVGYLADVFKFGSDLEESFWGAGLAFVVAVVVALIVTTFTKPKEDDELRGLVYGLGSTTPSGEVILAGSTAWWRNPVVLGLIAVILALVLYIPIW